MQKTRLAKRHSLHGTKYDEGWIELARVWLLSGVIACLAGCGKLIVQPVPETIPAAPTSATSAGFPLSRQTGQRCLVDRAGRPFLFHGDAAWSLLVQLKREDVDIYLEDRRRRGFNTILVNLIEHKFADRAPRNAYGEAPFVAGADYAQPNEKYFAHVDWVLGRAVERGFLVLLAPSYLGYAGGGEGWYREMQANGVERLRAYGRYLGTRYRNMPNIIWMEGGDYNPGELALVEAIVEGLRESNPKALHSFHGARGTAARAFLDDRADWLNLNTIYTDEKNVVAAALAEYKASSLPFFLVEARYEREGASEAVVRTQAYQAMLSGACGQVMGNKSVWRFDPEWKGALDSPGARSMARMRELLDANKWWQLRPVPSTFVSQGSGAGAGRIAAAVSADGKLAVVYVPGPRVMIFDFSALNGSMVTARWIDPASGQSINLSESPLATTPHTFQTPARNSSGFGDWLLILESH